MTPLHGSKQGRAEKQTPRRKKKTDTEDSIYSRQISSSYRLLDAEDLGRMQRNWTLSLIMLFSSVVVKSARLWMWHLSRGLLCQSFVRTYVHTFPREEVLSSSFIIKQRHLGGGVFVLLLRVGRHVPEGPFLGRWLIICLELFLIK